MKNYSASPCTVGSPADAFAFAASTGVAADAGEQRQRFSAQPAVPRCPSTLAPRSGSLTTLPPLPTARPCRAGYPYRALHGGADVNAPGRQAQCARAALTGQAAKLGTARITGTPALTAVPASKLGLITALGAQPAVASIAVDASFQHYAGGIWSSPTCNGEPGSWVGVKEEAVHAAPAALPCHLACLPPSIAPSSSPPPTPSPSPRRHRPRPVPAGGGL